MSPAQHGRQADRGLIPVSSPPLLGYLWRAAIPAVPMALLMYGVARTESSRTRAASHLEAVGAALVCALVVAGIWLMCAWLFSRELRIDPARGEVVVRGERAPFADVLGVAFVPAKPRRSTPRPGAQQPLGRRVVSVKDAPTGGIVHVTLASGRQVRRPFRARMIARTMPEQDARLIAALVHGSGAQGGALVVAAFARHYGWAHPMPPTPHPPPAPHPR